MTDDPEALLRDPIDASQLRVVSTPDGSHTLYDERLGAYYRSTSGAASEVRHVFFHSSGLLDRRRDLFAAGLWAASMPGTGAKHEITVAALDKSALPDGAEPHGRQARDHGRCSRQERLTRWRRAAAA